MTKIAGSGSISQRHGSADPEPDPLVRGMDTRIRIHPKMSWIRNTGPRRCTTPACSSCSSETSTALTSRARRMLRRFLTVCCGAPSEPGLPLWSISAPRRRSFSLCAKVRNTGTSTASYFYWLVKGEASRVIFYSAFSVVFKNYFRYRVLR
jgi:hypothetical protein